MWGFCHSDAVGLTSHLFCFSASASALPLRGGLSVPSCEEHGSDLTVMITMFRCDTAQLRLDQKCGAILLCFLGACQGATHCHIRVSLLVAFRFRGQNWPLHVEDLGLHKQTGVSGPSPASFGLQLPSQSYLTLARAPVTLRGAFHFTEFVLLITQLTSKM